MLGDQPGGASSEDVEAKSRGKGSPQDCMGRGRPGLYQELCCLCEGEGVG